MSLTLARIVGSAALAVAFLGCGSSGGDKPSRHESDTGRATATQTSRTLELYTDVYGAGRHGTITAFGRAVRTVTARPDGSATIQIRDEAGPLFPSAAMAARWRAAGSPMLAAAQHGEQEMDVPSGYSFLPDGTRLGYSEVLALPRTAAGVHAIVAQHLQPLGSDPVLLLKDYAFLLGAAPLSASARHATIQAIDAIDDRTRNMPAPSACATRTCATDEGQTAVLALSNQPRSPKVILSIRLSGPSRFYPGLTAGTTVERYEFGPEG